MNPEKRKSFLSVLFVTAIDNFGFGIVFVMFAPLLLDPQYNFLPAGTSVAVRNLYLAILFAAYPLTQFFGAPILGDFADRAGRKKALIITITGCGIGFLLSGIASVFTSINFLIFSRLLSGFFSGNLSICLAAIADMSPTEKLRAKNFGLVTVIWGLTWIIAMLTGGYLSNPSVNPYFSPALPFWITAALTFLALLALGIYYKETHETKGKVKLDFVKGIRNIQHAFKLPKVRPYFWGILIWTIGWGLSVQWFATYSILKFGASQQNISWGLFIQGLFWMLGGSVLNPLLLKRYGSLAIAFIGLSATTLLLFLTLIPSTYFGFASIYWLAALATVFGFSNLMNLASIHAPEGIQGKIMGLSQSMMSFGWVIVPLFGGTVGAEDVSLFYPLSGLFVLISALILLRQLLKTRKA